MDMSMMSMSSGRSFAQPQDNMSMFSVRSSGYRHMSKEERVIRSLKTQTHEKLIESY